MKVKNILKLFVILLFFKTSYAQESNLAKDKSWYVPDYVKVQTAGNIGFLSVGAGYQLFNKILYTELLYGFVPEFISKADRIHLITLKNTFPIYRKEIGKQLTITPIAGFTATMDVGPNTFTTLPDRFPDGYYFPNAFHATLFVGAMVNKKFKESKGLKGIDFYAELGTVETYLWYLITSSEVRPNNVFSAAIGVNFYL